jgi:hypothetical protein
METIKVLAAAAATTTAAEMEAAYASTRWNEDN